MPYYISTEKIESPTLSLPNRPRYIPLGGDAKGANWIWLNGGRSLLWIPVANNDKKLIKISDDKGEFLTTTTRNALNNLLGDRTISSTTPASEVIADLLLNPPVGMWDNLKPSKKNQRNEIWLGPNRELLWSQNTSIGPNTKSVVDTFPTDGNLDGATSSDGKFTWDEEAGTLLAVTSGKATIDPPDTTGVFCYARANYDFDTYNVYAQSDLVLTVVTTSDCAGEVFTRLSTGGATGYYFEVRKNNNVYSRTIADIDDNVLGSDSEDSISSTIRIEADGSSISGWVNGSKVLGPYTDSTYGSTSHGGIGGWTELNAGNLITHDNFAAGDLVVAVEQEGFRFRNDDGSESTATWKAAQDTNIILAGSTAFRLRMILNATGDPDSIGAQLECRYKPSGGAFGSWAKVTS